MNEWNEKLLRLSAPGLNLKEQAEELFCRQRRSWKAFHDGEAALGKIRTRLLSDDTGHVIVQANPGRLISTNARVDPASIARRPCFLCPAGLPGPERGIAAGNYVMLPNPFPILNRHLTIALRRHEPQLLDGRIGELLSLTRALGPDIFVLYNGPRCGASAPDHMHFQACSARGVPLFENTFFPGIKIPAAIKAVTLWGRNCLAVNCSRKQAARERIEKAIGILREITGAADEPMFNIVSLYRRRRYEAYLFPRAKHRSACYYAGPRQRISVSPAAIEMAGIIVVADIGHFERVDHEAVKAMYREVTLDNDRFSFCAKAVS